MHYERNKLKCQQRFASNTSADKNATGKNIRTLLIMLKKGNTFRRDFIFLQTAIRLIGKVGKENVTTTEPVLREMLVRDLSPLQFFVTVPVF